MAQSILVVDDDQAILQGIAILLRQSGYAVQCAVDGSEATAQLSGPTLPSLIILDVVLPGASGLDVCQAIRRLPVYVPVLMLSARDDVVDKVLGLEIGADEYLTKPFEPRELIARVRALLRFAERIGTPSADDGPLVYGSISMWPAAHRLEIGGLSVSLPPKEWALLELFLRHPAKVFGRETLLCQIWGYDFNGDSRTVDVHIQRLRARLDEATGLPVIETVRGFGYRLTALASVTPTVR